MYWKEKNERRECKENNLLCTITPHRNEENVVRGSKGNKYWIHYDNNNNYYN